jgi:hypothetical protein
MIKEAMAARKRMRWRGWLTDALDDVADGVVFPLELRYVRDVERAHGLPAARLLPGAARGPGSWPRR